MCLIKTMVFVYVSVSCIHVKYLSELSGFNSPVMNTFSNGKMVEASWTFFFTILHPKAPMIKYQCTTPEENNNDIY